MRVLHVLANLAVDSGVSSIVVGLSQNTDTIHFDFLILRETEISYSTMLKKRGSNVYCVGNILSPKTYFSSLKNIKDFLKSHAAEYDVIHLHSPTIHSFTLKYAKKYGISLRIIHSHSTMTSMNPLKKIINKILLKNIDKYANKFFACSTEAAEFLYGKDFCNTNQIELIYNAVDCSRFIYAPVIARSIREKLDIKNAVSFVHVSNYSPIKNHIFLLNIIERFKKHSQNVRFIFVGNGPTRKSFEDEIDKRDLRELCVFIDKTQNVAQYLHAADAAILPSLKEGLPVMLVEAQAAGLPFFTSDTVTREVRIGQGEFIPLNTDEWYETLSKFIPLSEEERKTRSEEFQKSVFNITIETERVARLYEKLARGD